jgi:MFS family permease
MMSMFFFLTQFLQDVRGFSALATGLAFLPLAAGMFLMTRLVPRLLPRFGPRPLAVTGAATMVAGLAWLTTLHSDSGYVDGLLGPMVLLGLGGGLGFVLLTPVIMATVPPRDAGAAGGALQTMQQTGATLGLAILVTVFGSATRGASGTPREVVVQGMTTAFTVAALIASLTLLVALTFRRAHP